MRVEIVSLTRNNFHSIVTMVWEIMHGEHPDYKRSEAEKIVRDNGDRVVALEVNSEVAAFYIYTETPMVYNLNFFGISPLFRKTKMAYRFYKYMLNHLSKKPIIISIYSDNKDMINLASKKWNFIGRFPARDNKIIEYYSIGDKGAGSETGHSRYHLDK